MAKVQKPNNTSEQAAEPASDSEEIIPVLGLETLTLNKQGQFVWRRGIIRQIADQPGEARAPVARRRRGRPREYDRDAMTRVAEDLILIGIDTALDRFVERVWNECKPRGIKRPKNPLTTMLTEICKPVYERAQSVKK